MQKILDIEMLNKLYGDKYKKKYRIEAKIENYPDLWDIDLIHLYDNTADCKIGHFGYNFYFRTSYGINSSRYQSIDKLKKDIIKEAKKNGLEVEYILFYDNDKKTRI